MNFKTLDFVLLAFFAVFFFFGYKKGFFRSFLSFFGLLLISLVAPNISSGASKKIYKSFMEEKVNSVVEKVLESTSEKVYKRQLDKALHKLDPLSSIVLRGSGVCNVETFLTNNFNKEVINNIVRERSLRYIEFLLTLVIFLILMVISRILLKRFSLRNLPVIGGIDAVLGGALGLLECLVLVFSFFYMFSLFNPFFSESKGSFLIYNSVKESLAFKYFKEFDFWNFVK